MFFCKTRVIGFPIQSNNENEVSHQVTQPGLTLTQEDQFDIIKNKYTTTWDLQTTYALYQSDYHEILMKEETG